MDKHEKNTILTIRDYEWRVQHHNASGTKESKIDNLNKNTMEMKEIANTPFDNRNMEDDENQQFNGQDRVQNHSG